MSFLNDVTVTRRLRRLVFLLVGLMLTAMVTGTVAVLGAYRQVERLATVLGPAADANTTLLQTLTDAETGLRAYDASQEPVLLQPYVGAHQRADAYEKQLRSALEPEGARWSDPLDQQAEWIEAWWRYAEDSRARGNAVKFSRTGGVVSLLTHCEDRFSGNAAMLAVYREFLEFLAADSRFAFSTTAEVLQRAGI